MNRLSIIVFVFAFSPAFASDSTITKLQCDGAFSDFEQQVENVAFKGMYVEVGSSAVRISGAPDFDGTYEIVNRKDEGVGFQSGKNKDIEGFLGRFSGQFSVSEKAGLNSDTAPKVKRFIRAVCAKAQPLF